MSIKIQCPNCSAKSSINDRLAGRPVRCPQCEALIQVPSSEQIAAARRRKHADTADPLQSAEEIPWASAIPTAGMADAATAGPAGSDGLNSGSDDGAEQSGEDDGGYEPLPIGGRGNREETEMDMTPMVDVTFLLLIFFMVTASFALQKSIAMPRQQSDAPSSQPVEQEQDELDQVTVQIDERGAFLVLAADWEREVAGKPSLVTALREAKPSSSGGVRLAIECHEAAKLQSLVDAMDAGTICDYAELQVTQVDGF